MEGKEEREGEGERESCKYIKLVSIVFYVIIIIIEQRKVMIKIDIGFENETQFEGYLSRLCMFTNS